jgi:hypothetical protein
MTMNILLHIKDSLYVPSAPMSLLSPQTIAQQTKHHLNGLHAKGNKGFFTFSPHILTSHLSSHVTSLLASESTTTTTNLTPTQRKLLLKHQQLSHISMQKLQQLVKEGLLGPQLKEISNCQPPLCNKPASKEDNTNAT